MKFTVEAPDPALVHQIETGPQFVCRRGDEDCAFYAGGPCTAVECTCETTGVCESCR